MPINPYEKEEQKTQAQEEVEAQEEEVVGEPKYSAEARDNDPQTKQVAQSVFNKIFEIKNEEEVQNGEKPSDVIQSNHDFVSFNSDGKDQVLVVQPSDSDVSYNIELVSTDGKMRKTIPNRRGDFKARMSIDKGEYKIIIKSQGGPVPFAVKVK